MLQPNFVCIIFANIIYAKDVAFLLYVLYNKYDIVRIIIYNELLMTFRFLLDLFTVKIN